MEDVSEVLRMNEQEKIAYNIEGEDIAGEAHDILATAEMQHGNKHGFMPGARGHMASRDVRL